jgi:3-methyl-2-oxobutanoate hydroxymethyltransferase
MRHHTAAVSRGTTQALIVGDMPFLSYHLGEHKAIENAGRFISIGGANAVKLEGGKNIAEIVRAITNAGVPVMGHLGLTPQSINQLGGFSTQGKTENAAKILIEDAKILEDCGAFSIVLECIPHDLAAEITKSVSIPTIGIGAGPHCDGQVLVLHDMLGLYNDFTPSFVKKYANLHTNIKQAISQYINEVKNGEFPLCK